jgi:UPF0716 family protein affecting phage T7 exclusion
MPPPAILNDFLLIVFIILSISLGCALARADGTGGRGSIRGSRRSGRSRLLVGILVNWLAA